MLDRKPVIDWRTALYPEEAEQIGRIDKELAELARRKRALLSDLAPIRSRAHKRAVKLRAEAA